MHRDFAVRGEPADLFASSQHGMSESSNQAMPCSGAHLVESQSLHVNVISFTFWTFIRDHHSGGLLTGIRVATALQGIQ